MQETTGFLRRLCEAPVRLVSSAIAAVMALGTAGGAQAEEAAPPPGPARFPGDGEDNQLI
ncbi:hypothetical protein [Paracraurococcus ruber]|uniref:Uncharacterized protein n=1 Tax=Paracraurococcus ruber TaxID=77675 RepID=A0ABS1D3R0_9PROT|nr:hypothetical protein [Paracraurococcus ruber]MBK1661496.1 hypothetical protein [Paracraurococcus ruber]TDG28256.1 hypothetical protein E2C05_20895 [Paracraurococcus ruber]